MKIQMQTNYSTKNNPNFSSSYQFTAPAGRAGSAALAQISEILKYEATASLKSSRSQNGVDWLRMSCSRNINIPWDVLVYMITKLKHQGITPQVFYKPDAHSKTVSQLRAMTFKPYEEVLTTYTH